MTPNIEAQISRLRSVFVRLKNALDEMTAIKGEIEKERNTLVSEISALKVLNNTLNQEVLQLKQTIDKQKMQGIEKSEFALTARNDDEIDALVKEIEHCITQLKNRR
jgi:chromosome segregation ATPase